MIEIVEVDAAHAAETVAPGDARPLSTLALAIAFAAGRLHVETVAEGPQHPLGLFRLSLLEKFRERVREFAFFHTLADHPAKVTTLSTHAATICGYTCPAMFFALLVRTIAPFLAVATVAACRPDVGLAADRARAYLADVQPDLAALEVHVRQIGEANPTLATRREYLDLVEAIAASREAISRLEIATAPDQPRDLERIAQALLAAAAAWRVVDRARGIVDTIAQEGIK